MATLESAQQYILERIELSTDGADIEHLVNAYGHLMQIRAFLPVVFVDRVQSAETEDEHRKLIIGDDGTCPVTGKHCDDECCSPGAECNLSGRSEIIEK